MYSRERLQAIFRKTDGRCRYCGKQLAFPNYGRVGRRGAWAVDHSVSKANGGSDHGNNLYASCVDCNQDKGATNGASYKARRRRRGQHVAKRSWWSGDYK